MHEHPQASQRDATVTSCEATARTTDARNTPEHPGITQARVDAGIDKAALAEALVAKSHRVRTPSELADQLERDATSLELTGASFTKDEAFYRAVSANVRETLRWLREWQPMLEAMERGEKARRQQSVRTVRADCAGLAREVRDLVSDSVDGPRAHAWRAAAEVIRHAILAHYEDETR